MARWVCLANQYTPVVVADTTNMTAAGFMVLQGGSTTQRLNILEVYLGGGATASTVNNVIVGRDSTVFAGVTSNAAQVNALDPATAALGAPPLGSTVGSTTLPKRSSSGYLLALTFNAFGGVVRWVAAPGEELGMLGNTASNGEVSISTTAGAGAMSNHIIFEPF